jgi:hypothetical protein
MFSLCIPTLDRYDEFLSKYLFVYLENDLIQEIIITDENGRDIEKIKEQFDHPKLRLFRNETRLGALLNKHRAASLAQNEWIALIDSDNLAEYDYFATAKNYIESIKDQPIQNVILAPCFAKPHFNYSHLSGLVFKKGEFQNNKRLEMFHPNSYPSNVLMNTGNYIIHKHLIEHVDLRGEDFSESNACDVILLNTILFEQLDLHLHVVKGLEYMHVCHSGSIYMNTWEVYRHFTEKVHKRYNNLV